MADEFRVEVTEQPLHQRLKHGTPLHGNVMARLDSMIDDGRSFVGQREKDWTYVDHSMRMYIDLDRKAKNADKSEDNDKKHMPFSRAVVIPVTYASLMTRMVELYAIMTARDPLVHYEGTDPEDHTAARFHEAIIRYDNMQSRAALVVWQLLFDQERYGICAAYDTWEEDWGWIHGQNGDESWGLRKEWVNWAAINPRRLILDPNFSTWNPQRADFIGHEDTYSWLYLKENERRDDGSGIFFNVDEARAAGGSEDDTDDDSLETTGATAHTEYDTPVGTISFLKAKIIPSEWQLSDVDRPQKWWFAVWEKKVIVRAHRCIFQHDEFNYSIGQMDLDMHAAFVPGMGEQLRGIQDISDWMAAAHGTNVRKTIHNEAIYAPSLINPKEVLQPQPGKWTALTPKGEQLLQKGMLSIDQMYSQKKMVDITGGHMQEVQHYLTFAQRVSAASDPMQAMPLPTKRTLGEYEGVKTSGTKRIGTTAGLFDMLVMEPLARRAISLRQQFTSRAQRVRLTGRLAKQIDAHALNVTPEHLVGEYDYIPHTPTMAPDPARQGAVWMQLLQILGGAPQLLRPNPLTGKKLNPHAILDEVVQSQGVKYLDSFYEGVNNAEVKPQEQIDERVQAGQFVPMEGIG